MSRRSLTIKGDGASYAQLKQVPKRSAFACSALPDVTKVDRFTRSGRAHLRRIQPSKLATFGRADAALFDSLSKQKTPSISRRIPDLGPSACRCA